MENKSHALAAGTFVLVVAALLAMLAAWLARDTGERRIFEISSRETVTGLQEQASVRYKGVTVGKVTAIGLDRQSPGNVLVRIAVNDAAPMTASTFATLGFQGVTGLAFVQLDDAGGSTAELATTLEKPARIPLRPGLMARLSDQGSSLVDHLEQASERANALLDSDNQKNLMLAIAHLGAAAAQVEKLSQHADQFMTGSSGQGKGGLQDLVQQATLAFKNMQTTAEHLSDSADSVRTSSAAFQRMSERMTGVNGTLDKMANSMDALVPQINQTAQEATRTVRKMGVVAQSVGDNPQSLLLGTGAPPPGPGEPGFVAPSSR